MVMYAYKKILLSIHNFAQIESDYVMNTTLSCPNLNHRFSSFLSTSVFCTDRAKVSWASSHSVTFIQEVNADSGSAVVLNTVIQGTNVTLTP